MSSSKDLPPLTHFGKVFWTNQFRTKIELPDPQALPSLQGKLAIITGANSGLGFESARQLLSLGLSRLIMAVRSAERGELAATLLRKENPAAEIEVWQLDMESYDSIQEFVLKCNKDLPRVDYTILNAGVAPIHFSKLKQTGHETAIQVNHISTALLAVLLLPVLIQKSPAGTTARLTIVNSLTAHLCKFPNRHSRPLLSSFDDTEVVPWDPQERYGVSKLLNQLFIARLCDHVDRDKVTVNMVDPGLTKGTALSRDTSGMLRLGAKMFIGAAGRPVDRGAATYVNAILVQDRKSHGSFLMSNKIAPLAGLFYEAEGAEISKQIWEETLDELKFADIQDLIDRMA